MNGGNVGFFSTDFSGIARAGDIEIVVKGGYIPLMQQGGLFEMGLLGATQGDLRRWAKSRGTELGVATVTDGGSVEVGNEFDKRLEKAFMKSVKNGDRKKCRKKSSMPRRWSRQRERWQRHQARQQTRRSPGTMRRIFRTVRGARCACKEKPGKVDTNKARPVEVTERTLVQVDSCHMTCNDIAGKPKLTIFVAVENRHGEVLSLLVRRQGSSYEHIVKGFAAWMDALDSGLVIVRSDAEPAIGDVVKEAVSRREKTELQLSPKRSKGALGAAEATYFAVESQLTTMRLGLLARYPSEKVRGKTDWWRGW